MPESVKIKVELDTRDATASLEELERRLMKLRPGIAKAFSAGGFGRLPEKTRREIFEQYGLGKETVARSASIGRGGIEEFDIEKYPQKRSARGRQATQQMAESMKFYENILTRRLKAMNMGWNFPSNPQGAQFMLDDPKALAARAREAMRMGPLHTGTNWRQAGLGAGLSLFSPWLGARMLNQAFGGFPGGGGGGGKSGGLLGAMFGGGSTGFAEWYLLIRTIGLLNKAFQEMFHAIEKGSEIYRQAAATATSTHQFARLQAVLGGIGLGGSTARLIEQGQFGRGGQVRSAGEIIVRAHQGAMGMGELQQMVNMRKEMEYLFKESEHGARILGDTAASMNRLNMQVSLLKLDWAAFWADLTQKMELPLRLLLGVARMVLQGFHNLTAWIPKLWERMLKSILGETLYKKFMGKVFPFTSPGNDLIGGNAPSRPESAWEKMGLIINGSIAGRDYARQTAENTKKIADNIHKLFPGADNSNYITTGQPNFNLA